MHFISSSCIPIYIRGTIHTWIVPLGIVRIVDSPVLITACRISIYINNKHACTRVCASRPVGCYLLAWACCSVSNQSRKDSIFLPQASAYVCTYFTYACMVDTCQLRRHYRAIIRGKRKKRGI